MVELVEAIHETCSAAVLDGAEIVYVARVLREPDLRDRFAAAGRGDLDGARLLCIPGAGIARSGSWPRKPTGPRSTSAR